MILDIESVLKSYKSRSAGILAMDRYKDWFPLYSSPELAGLVADLTGDGHLQDYPKFRLDYTSNSKKELIRFNNEIFKLFGIKGKIRECTTNKYRTMNLGINNKPLARTLKLIGIPTGSKVMKSFRIPEWILNNKLFFARYMNRLTSCEGSIDSNSKYIEIKMSKEIIIIENGVAFFEDIKNYLEFYFRIKSTRPFLEGRENVRKDGKITKGVRLKIKNKESLRIFFENIGIDNIDKREKLLELVS